jgi:hypothetical protein
MGRPLKNPAWHEDDMAIFTMVFMPLFTAIICSVGIFIGLRKRKRHAAERAAWREAYRTSPEANLINLHDFK